MKSELIPDQRIGKQMDIVEQRLFLTESEAVEFMKLVTIRFFNINDWQEICDSASSEFFLVDAITLEITREVKEGNYIKIDIPGPSTKTGKGFDWVRINSIFHKDEANHQIVVMTVQPVAAPESNTEASSHFFTSDATSTFIIERIDNQITAEVHGRNEVANSDTENTMDNIRNKMVSLGSKIGLSYPQWNNLAKGLLE